MPKKTSKPGDIHLKIVEVLKRFPEGISGGQIRQELEKEGLRAEDQTHLDRRKRDLKKWFVIQKAMLFRKSEGKNGLSFCTGTREKEQPLRNLDRST